MMDTVHVDGLHRLVKQVIDSGSASSIEEAIELFDRLRLHIQIDDADLGKV